MYAGCVCVCVCVCVCRRRNGWCGVRAVVVVVVVWGVQTYHHTYIHTYIDECMHTDTAANDSFLPLVVLDCGAICCYHPVVVVLVVAAGAARINKCVTRGRL